MSFETEYVIASATGGDQPLVAEVWRAHDMSAALAIFQGEAQPNHPWSTCWEVQIHTGCEADHLELERLCEVAPGADAGALLDKLRDDFGGQERFATPAPSPLEAVAPVPAGAGRVGPTGGGAR